MLNVAVLLGSRLLILLLFVSQSQTASHLASGPHIADVNILLPPRMTHPVEYRLQGSDGCFKWYHYITLLYTRTHWIMISLQLMIKSINSESLIFFDKFVKLFKLVDCVLVV